MEIAPTTFPFPSTTSNPNPVSFGFVQTTNPSVTISPSPSTPNPTCSVKLSNREKTSIVAPWSESVIMYVRGLKIFKEAMLEKLMKLWKLKSTPIILPLGKGFFLLKFSAVEDRWKAILNGPTLINGQFMSLQPWKPRFNTELALTSASSPVWIKLRGLPIEFYNPEVLLKIGDSIGSFLGIDDFTHNLVKIGFARICVLVDLTKELPEYVTVDDFNQAIVYEGDLGFCLSCGDISHSTVSCRTATNIPRAAPLSPVALPLLPPPLNPPSNWITVRHKKCYPDLRRTPPLENSTTLTVDRTNQEFEFQMATTDISLGPTFKPNPKTDRQGPPISANTISGSPNQTHSSLEKISTPTGPFHSESQLAQNLFPTLTAHETKEFDLISPQPLLKQRSLIWSHP